MALTVRAMRWTPARIAAWSAVAVAAGVTLGITIASKLPTPSNPTPYTSADEALIARSRYGMLNTARTARAIVLRDSIASTFRGRRSLSIAVDPRIAAADRQRLELQLATKLAWLFPKSPRVPVVLFVPRDSSEVATLEELRPGTLRIRLTAIPRDATGDPCIVIEGVWPRFDRATKTAVTNAAGETGLAEVIPSFRSSCVWFARHGFPGAGVREHLRLTINTIGRPVRRRVRDSWYIEGFYDIAIPQLSVARELTYASALACVAGRIEWCEAELRRRTRDGAWTIPGQSARAGWQTGQGARISLLADIAEEVGPDRFQAIWDSDLSLTESYRAATGRSLPELLHRRMQVRYGSYTPADSVRSVDLVFLVVVLLGVGAAIITQTRRQIGA